MTMEDRIKSLKALNEDNNSKRIRYVCNKCGFNILGKINGYKGIEIKQDSILFLSQLNIFDNK
jgi:hypothetical protein